MPRLYGPILDDSLAYKLEQTRSRKPELLAIGSSQVRDLRASMFAGCGSRPDCFYDATNTGTTVHADLEFLQALGRDRAPRVLLLGLDMWQFDPGWQTDKHVRRENILTDFSSRLDYAYTVTQRVLRFAFYHTDSELMLPAGEFRHLLVSLTPAPRDVRGSRALLTGAGYRADGSYARGPQALQIALSTPSAERVLDSLERLQHAESPYVPFEKADDRSLAEVAELLDVAESYGTRVIAFTTPLSNEIAGEVQARADLQRGRDDVETELRALFDARHVPFLATTSLASIGCRQNEHWDGEHPTEPCLAVLVQRLTQIPGARGLLAPYVNADELAALIANARSAFSLTGDE